MKKILTFILVATVFFACKEKSKDEPCWLNGYEPSVGICIIDTLSNIYSPEDYSQLVFTHTFVNDIENKGVIIDNDSIMTLLLYYDNKVAFENEEEPVQGIDTIFIKNTKSRNEVDTLIIEFTSIENHCMSLEYDIVRANYINGKNVVVKKVETSSLLYLYE